MIAAIAQNDGAIVRLIGMTPQTFGSAFAAGILRLRNWFAFANQLLRSG